jgi:hypothetical protein
MNSSKLRSQEISPLLVSIVERYIGDFAILQGDDDARWIAAFSIRWTTNAIQDSRRAHHRLAAREDIEHVTTQPAARLTGIPLDQIPRYTNESVPAGGMLHIIT